MNKILKRDNFILNLKEAFLKYQPMLVLPAEVKEQISFIEKKLKISDKDELTAFNFIINTIDNIDLDEISKFQLIYTYATLVLYSDIKPSKHCIYKSILLSKILARLPYYDYPIYRELFFEEKLFNVIIEKYPQKPHLQYEEALSILLDCMNTHHHALADELSVEQINVVQQKIHVYLNNITP